MKKRSVKLFVLLSIALLFVFSGVAQGYHTHDTSHGYTFNELRNIIKERNGSYAGDYASMAQNHVWLNEKCIWFFEQQTGIELSETAKFGIILGGITADYDVFD